MLSMFEIKANSRLLFLVIVNKAHFVAINNGEAVT